MANCAKKFRKWWLITLKAHILKHILHMYLGISNKQTINQGNCQRPYHTNAIVYVSQNENHFLVERRMSQLLGVLVIVVCFLFDYTEDVERDFETFTSVYSGSALLTMSAVKLPTRSASRSNPVAQKVRVIAA